MCFHETCYNEDNRMISRPYKLWSIAWGLLTSCISDNRMISLLYEFLSVTCAKLIKTLEIAAVYNIKIQYFLKQRELNTKVVRICYEPNKFSFTVIFTAKIFIWKIKLNSLFKTSSCPWYRATEVPRHYMRNVHIFLVRICSINLNVRII
jgi:hypothetical protein